MILWATAQVRTAPAWLSRKDSRLVKDFNLPVLAKEKEFPFSPGSGLGFQAGIGSSAVPGKEGQRLLGKSPGTICKLSVFLFYLN